MAIETDWRMNKQDSLKPSSQCEELADLLPAYAAGALSSQEAEHVKALLEKCPDMQLEAAQYATLMTGFYDRIPPVPPPMSLHKSLMKKVREKKAAQDIAAREDKGQELMALQTDIQDDQVK